MLPFISFRFEPTMKMKLLASAIFILIFSTAKSQSIDSDFFDKLDEFLISTVEEGLINYSKLKTDDNLTKLIERVQDADLKSLDEITKKAFYINAYNLLVINEIVKIYPISSVQDKGGFFDRNKVRIAGEMITLNNFEKQRILKQFDDPRLHFVLVCGATGCPPITAFAYRPEALEQQLDTQTKIALNNPNFIKVAGDKIGLSQIFDWYAEDFGTDKKSIIRFINKYRTIGFDESVDLDYYAYNWALNDAKADISIVVGEKTNSSRYIVSSTIPIGSIELKIFNNLYSQRSGSKDALTDRASFFTTSASFLYGVKPRLNLGFVTRYRRVDNSTLPSSPFDVLKKGREGFSRQGITAFGPQIRYAPIPKWGNFSIQSNIAFPIGKDLSGSSTQPYIDWGAVSWTTQFFNDRSIGSYFSFFTDIGIIWEDIGRFSKGRINQFSTPATAILSYFPNRKTTFYALAGVSPYFRIPFDYFLQGGFGTKYQFTPNIELELLYTGFTNTYLLQTRGDAQTFNVGLRMNI